MAQLQWRDAPEQSAPRLHPSSSATKTDPWFGIAMGLVGVIVGYIIGNF